MSWVAHAYNQDTAVYSALTMGTGWGLTKHHVVTNYHVIAGVKNLRLVAPDQKEIAVKVVAVDKKNDLAILEITGDKDEIKPLPLAQDSPRLGSRVFTVGYPHPNLMGTSPKLTSGFINAINGLADDPRTFQVSVPVQAGNSGGPLLNMRGEVVGIITSKLSAQKMFEWTGDVPQNVNYAIKLSRLESIIHKLDKFESVYRGNNLKNKGLEELAGTIIGSVVIVAGDGENNNNDNEYSMFTIEQHNSPPDEKNRLKVLVYSFAEPGKYDLVENIEGSASISKYSDNTVKVLKRQLTDHLHGNVIFESDSGKEINKLFYELEEIDFSSKLCRDRSADFIVASHSESQSGQGAHFRSVYYRLFDCKVKKEYKREYKLERDERNDSFGYEVALYTSFKDFLIKIPPYLRWASN